MKGKNKMFERFLAGICLIGVVVFSSLWFTAEEHSDIQEQVIEEYQDSIKSLDSKYNKADSLANLYADSASYYRKEKDNYKGQRDYIYDKYKDLKSDIDTITTDSLAEYIINNFAGNDYKIYKADKDTYVALLDTTVRDIVLKDLERKECEEIKDNLSKELLSADSLIYMQSKQLGMKENKLNILEDKYKISQSIIDEINSNYETLKEEYKGYKRKVVIREVVAGGIVVALIIIAL